jgi:beta-lactamase regulating signal transducer with metallopeptidase domain
MTALENWLPGDHVFLWGINLLVLVTLISMAALLTARCVRRSPAVKWEVLRAGLVLVLISPGIVLIAQATGISLVSVSLEGEPVATRTRPVIRPIVADREIQSRAETVSGGSVAEVFARPSAGGEEIAAMTATTPSRFDVGGDPDGIEAMQGTFAPSAELSAASAVRCLLAFLFAAWCCGTALFLVRLARAWWKLETIRRTARPISTGIVDRVVRGVCDDLQISRMPRVTASTRVGSPIAVGVWRPEVILPEGLLNQLGHLELRSVLTHEVAHIARRDLIVVFGQNLAVSLLWLHPLVHVLNRQLALAREEVCDNYVLGTIDAPSYSRILLRLAELIQVADPQLVSVSLLPGDWKLESRIAGILSDGRNTMTRLTRRSRSLVLMLSAAIAVVGAHVTMTFSEGVEPDKESATQTAEVSTAAADGVDPEEPADTSAAAQFRFAGQVVTPDGNPVGGARIYFATRKARQLAMTDAEGHFEFTRKKSQLPNRAQWGVNRLVAVADGYGPAWLKAIIFDVSGNARSDWETRNPNSRFPRVWESTERVLKLVEDDVPIQGRIVDLEGRPVEGVAIQPRFVDEIYARYAFDEVTTDANGAFEVHGVGRNRTVRLVAKGDHTAFSVFFARTEHGETITRPSRPIEDGPDFPGATRNVRVVYSARPVHAVAPSVPVEGSVTDADTGAPIAGVTIYAYGLENNPEVGRREEFNVITDEGGRYRMTGLPVGLNELLAIGDGSQPYLPAGVNVQTNDDESVLTRNFTLKRGVWLEGRVTDAANGDPVRATVEYSSMFDNPYLVQAPGFEQISAGGPYRTDQSGHYRLPVLPGPGIVTINAADRRVYPTGIMSEALAAEYRGGSMLLQTRPGLIFPLGFNFLASINPADTTSREELNIQLEAAPDVAVRFVDPDGQPLTGVSVTDYTQSNGFTTDDSTVLKGDVYVARNFLATQPRKLVAWHPEQNLAGQLVIREQPDGDLKFALQPAGAIRGRIVHEDGRPRPARFYRSLTNAPADLEYGLLSGTDDTLTTNADGDFEFRWLVPGLKYRVSAVHPTAGRFLGLLLDDVTVEAGETRDLGDVQIQRDIP